MVQNTFNSKIQIWLPLLLAVCTAFGMLIGFRMANETRGHDSQLVKKYEGEGNGKLGRVEELLRFIDAKYVDDIDEDKLLDAATQAIFDQLDPHSVYIPPTEIERINQRMSGYYKGVGIETTLIDDTLRITKVMDESPASDNGILYGDKLISIKDTIVAGVDMPIEDQWDLLKTEDDETLTLKVIHRNNILEEIELLPRKIQYPNVDYFYVAGVPYIKINKFSDDTYEELVKGLEYFQKEMVVDQLIIDLRENLGGYLQEATKILNQLFVEDKRLLVYTEGKGKKSEYNTTGRPFYKINKLAVLINKNSASASEIIAGAVQDWDKAIIIGEQSFGKGLVQDQFDLSNGGSIRLTTARYFTPTGRYIQTPFDSDKFTDSIEYKTKVLMRPLIAQGGITPDVEVSWSEDLELVFELAFRETNALAYKVIVHEQLYQETAVDLTQESINAFISEQTKDLLESNEISCEQCQVIFNSIIRQEIYTQLKQDQRAQKELVDRDIFISAAIEVLSKSDIFADFIK